MTRTTRPLTVIVGVSLVALVAAACGSSSTSSSATTTTGTSTKSAASTPTHRRSGSGAFGKVVSVAGADFVVDTSKGPLTVDTSASTTLTETAAATVSVLAAGQCVVAGEPANSIGKVSATTLAVSVPGPSGCTAGFGGHRKKAGSYAGFSGGSGSSSGASSPGDGSFSGTFGKIAQLTPSATGVTLEIQGPAGQVTVDVGSTTRILQRTATGLSAVSAGTCAAALGRKGSSGTVDATSVIVSQPGPSGCPTTYGRGRATTTS